MSVKFLVTSEGEAETHLKNHFRKNPIAAGRDLVTDRRFWYVNGKRCTMKPTGTRTGNGVAQYLVVVE